MKSFVITGIKHIEILAQHRGYSIGVEMAEAFEVYRIVS